LDCFWHFTPQTSTKFKKEKPRGEPLIMMATDILKQQHREFEELIRQIETAEDDEERAALRAELADMLAAHTAVEEELFYPTALEHLGHGARIRESLEEHAVADFALYRFVSVSVADETFLAKLATLKDVVMNHIEEEESELIPQVEGEVERHVLDQLGDKMAVRFEERLREGHRSILERSLGIAARQAAVAAPAQGAKKAAPVRRRTTKRKATPQKRAMKAGKQSVAPQRPVAAQKTATSKKAAAQAETNSRKASSSKASTSGRNQSSTRTSQKAGRRPARGQTAAKKSRAHG
jgi:hemerythrin-like domain-containing protein